MWIRPMEENDIPQLESIERECFSDFWSKELLKQTFEQKLDSSFVVEADCKIVGYINIRIIDSEAELMRIAVKNEFRGKGYAKLMMERMLCLVEAKEARIIRLEVRESNKAAIELYKSFGFEIEGVRKNYYNNPSEDAVLFCKYI